MSWAARPVGYTLKRDTETTFTARMMRWGGVLLAIFVVFHILHYLSFVTTRAPRFAMPLASKQAVPPK
jgi:succinate dehydrogenase / fumarate reductase cytochrome b subunit